LTIRRFYNFCRFVHCIQQKIHHITPPEYDDFVSTVVAMQTVSKLVQNGPVQFQLMLTDIKKSRSCKKDLWDRVMAAIRVQ
jgi:hypothetical protein